MTPTPKTNHFRRNLAAIAKARGVSKFAESAGITRVYLRRIIDGGCNPSIDVAIRLADAAGLTLGELLGRQKNLA